MEMKSKLLSGRELVELDPESYQIVETTINGEPVQCLNDVAFGPVIYESLKEGKEAFTEKNFLVRRKDLEEMGLSYEISAVIL